MASAYSRMTVTVLAAALGVAAPGFGADRPWTLLVEGLHGTMNFASDQGAATLELRHENERRAAWWARLHRARKFQRNATLWGLGGAVPVPIPKSAVAMEITASPNQDILPETTAEASFIHDPAGWLELVLRYRFSHYPNNNIHLINPTLIWMRSERVQLSAGYHATHTTFLGQGKTVPNHSYATRLLVRPLAWLHPWAAFSRAEESFEAGARGIGAFRANHYVGGLSVWVLQSVELRGSYDHEERDNGQITRTATAAAVLRW